MKSPDDILEELLSLPSENEIVEFKKAENQFDKDDLGKYFSALSNEANLKFKEFVPNASYKFVDDKNGQPVVEFVVSNESESEEILR